ncbi:non-ribosomal peptide synthetase [Janthinobacterium agaricidamnosum]|uniref:Amino acid adenylation domain protein n=1 Tax=Janthinobacterium agaricidamnosum NBRC 102515 = DSM 9628 TaxID=1349767 RepID=W0V8W5_9BURK|nr:non-ribosomal peptide synthetase [Janthinobacterium agaricidamnosum]CDG83717.1 amino acid adenylation domain protein [Janthinobacterium agaricidamnosum NBRC 102515 = DSM 9628]
MDIPHQDRPAQAAALPLSAAQYGIWLGQQLDPASPAYWTAETVELHGALNAAAFDAALRQAVAECDALHQRYASDGAQVWQTPAAERGWALERLDFSAAAAPFDAAQRWIQADLLQLADLRSGPLFGSALLTLGAARTLWYLRVHHIALDGFGYALLAQRVADLYSANAAGRPAPPPRPGALEPVIAEDRLYQVSAARARDRDFWCARLKDAPAPVLLAPARPVAHGVRRLRHTLPAASLAAWQAAAGAAGVDWSAWLIAAIAAWLQRQTGAGAVTLGLPVMGRLGSVSLGVPCMAMNIVPLHVPIGRDTGLGRLAQQVAADMRALRPHQRYRYEHLKHDLGLGDGSRRLFGAVVNLMPFDRPLVFGALAALAHPVSAGPVEDLSIVVAPGPDGVRLDFDANPDAYDSATLATLHAGLLATLALLADPAHDAAAPLMPDAAAPALLAGARLAQPPEAVLDALRRHAAETPQRLAVQQDGATLTYAELLLRVRQLAAQLRERGVRPDSRVVLLLPRAPETVAALLAILWAGAGYVPLDPDGPPLRIAAVLEDARPQLVLTLRRHAAKAGAGLALLCLDDDAAAVPAPMQEPVAVAADALAYVIYTSGSTGRPNGVMIGRDALAHFVAGATLRYQMSAQDRVLQFAPLHFDASVEEIFVSLCNGASLILRNDAMLESLPRFLQACARLHISVLDLPTAFWHELAFCISRHEAALPDSVRLLIIGGEAALAERVARWRGAVAPHVVLLNTYGPTEATVICTTARLAGPQALAFDGDAVPIGQPLPGVAVAVVDASLRPVGFGVEGELCLLGGALARGYLGRVALTAQRFVQLELAGEAGGARRAYRTGDRVLLGHDGQLRYLGRLDDELKLSGHRVDPLEIEAALLQYPGMREAAVVAQALADGGKRLLACLVADAALPAPEPAELRAFLAERLAAAALPAAYLALPQLPRNANGKIDRKALAALPLDAAHQAPQPDGPASPLEQAVMAVWRDVLGVGALRRSDDFFALGGKSLQVIQAANRLGIALQREVAVSALFRHRTVAGLAQALGALDGHAPPPAAAEAGAEFAPLLTIQRGAGPALFCVHPAEGLAWCYLGLTMQLPDTPIYGLQAQGISGALPASVERQVVTCLALLRGAQPHGPYHLLGWSSGGGIAHALAVRLQAAGEQVGMLAMMDAYPSDIWHGKPLPQRRDALLTLLDVIGASPLDADGQPLPEQAMLARFQQPDSTLAAAGQARIARLLDSALHGMLQYRELQHRPYHGDLLFFHAARRAPDAPDWLGWRPYVHGRMERVDIDSTHIGMSRPAPLAHIGRELARRLSLQSMTKQDDEETRP